MLWLRMLGVALRLGWPYLLTPWRSPLLRWRMETYGLLGSDGRILHADDLTPTRFFQFTIQHRQAVGRFLKWAALL